MELTDEQIRKMRSLIAGDSEMMHSIFDMAIMRGHDTHAERQLSAPGAGLSDGRELAEQFHDLYERLAPLFGYETREETKKFDPESPNGRLMIAVCCRILATLRAPQADPPDLAAKLADARELLERWTHIDARSFTANELSNATNDFLARTK